MTSKFIPRPSLQPGGIGSGLAVVLAGCASAPPRSLGWDQPEPDLDLKSAHRRRRPIPGRKKIIVRPAPGGGDSDILGLPRDSRGSGGGSGDGGGWPDRRLKTDIHPCGHSPSGLPIDRLRYIWGGTAGVGVMAHDLLSLRPEAVIATDGGYLVVNYDRIDVTMMTPTNHEMSRHRLATGCGFSTPRSSVRPSEAT